MELDPNCLNLINIESNLHIGNSNNQRE